MAYENYIAASKRSDRKPITLIGIESPTAKSEVLTTKADWEAGVVDATLDTVTQPGDVTLIGESGSWDTSSLNSYGRNRHGAAHYNGKIYLHGGLTNGSYIASQTNGLSEYDIATNLWSQKASGGVTAYGLKCVAVNGKVYSFGGRGTTSPGYFNRLFVYDIDTNVWGELAPCPQLAGVFGVAFHALVTDGTYIYMMGGQNWAGHNYICAKYHIASNTWSSMASLPKVMQQGEAEYVNGKIYYMAVSFTNPADGFSGYNAFLVYDTVNNTWSALANPVGGRGGFAYSAAVGEKIFFYAISITGWNTYAFYMYDYFPEANLFDPVPNTLSPQIGLAAMVADDDGNVHHTGGFEWGVGGSVRYIKTLRRGYAPSGTLETKVVDMGFIPTANTSFYVDDTIPADTSLLYTAEGSATGAFAGEEVSLGSVSDGGALAPYKYYKFTAVFATTEPTRTPTLKSITATGGDTEFVYFSTDNDNPVRGAKPYVAPGSLSVSTSRISLLEKPKTGEVSARLFWSKDTGDLIATGNLRNRAVIIKTGFDGMIEADFVPFFTGKFYDYTADPTKMEISIKLRDVFKQFKKIKYPFETSDASGNKTTVPVTWTADNIIQVMQDILTALNVPDRYIDTDAFNALKAGDRSGVDWDITRTLSKPEPVLDLLNELAVVAGIFLVPLPDGKLTPIVYDITGAAAATIDASNYMFSELKGGQANLYTRQLAYYNSTAFGHPGKTEDDFDRVLVKVNATAETQWEEKSQRNWYEKWNASANALQALVDRMDSWFASPKIVTRVNDVPTRYIQVEPGQIIEVDNLRTPVAKASWPGFSSAKKFLVMGKIVNPKKTTINFDLLEV